jgi:hypothetical protein
MSNLPILTSSSKFDHAWMENYFITLAIFTDISEYCFLSLIHKTSNLYIAEVMNLVRAPLCK